MIIYTNSREGLVACKLGLCEQKALNLFDDTMKSQVAVKHLQQQHVRHDNVLRARNPHLRIDRWMPYYSRLASYGSAYA